MSTSDTERPLLVTAAIIRDGQKILIAQRRFDSKNEGGKWEFPGGKVEFAEAPEACVIREINEELAVNIRIERLYDVVSHVFEVSGRKRHLVLVVYVAVIADSGKPQSIEVEDWKWVDLAQLKDYLFASADIKIVEKITRDGKL
jgi:8-oxo-dGTP diphosphatase